MNVINNKNQIIAALATPYGKSAVAIIRISGFGSIELVERFLLRKIGIGELKTNTFKADGFTERLMAVGFKAPRSYTGEDLVELYPHGNMTVCDGILKVLIGGGARLAERGEFTRRAFQNGKVDLMQCEALADIIDAQTTEQLVYGNKRYDGGFSQLKVAEDLLKKALSTVEAVLHYGDELEQIEIDGGLKDDVYSAIDRVIDIVEKEERGFAGGKIINDGFKVALIGQPNVGKSTLLNALTGSDRAIVTPIAGTTRDTVEGSYIYNGRKFVVTDTAGLNESTFDEVEKIGIERAKRAAEDADAVVIVTTPGEKAQKSDYALSVEVANKCDSAVDVGEDYASCEHGGVMEISAKLGKNVTALKKKLYDMCPKDFGAVCNHRQYGCICRCLSSLRAAADESKKAESLEIVAALLYEAYSAIAELHGETADENVISSVFERFCVGK